MASTSFPNHFFGKSATETRLFTSTLLFGVCASWMFIGFMIVQAFTYTRHYRKDSKFLKSIIYFVILLQLVEAGLESYEVYIVDSAGWGNPIAYLNLFVITVEDIQPMFASLTGFVVQCFFTWRIWVFSVAYILHPKVRILTRIVCAAIALVSALALIAGFTLGLSSVTMPALPRWFGTALSLWIISSAVADIMITICMMSLVRSRELYTSVLTFVILASPRQSKFILWGNSRSAFPPYPGDIADRPSDICLGSSSPPVLLQTYRCDLWTSLVYSRKIICHFALS